MKAAPRDTTMGALAEYRARVRMAEFHRSMAARFEAKRDRCEGVERQAMENCRVQALRSEKGAEAKASELRLMLRSKGVLQ